MSVRLVGAERDQQRRDFNRRMLDKEIQREKDLARLSDRDDGLVYVYASTLGETCKTCMEMFDGKVFLLYDGRSRVRYELPEMPHPSCKQPRETVDDAPCNFYWQSINPSGLYLKREKRYFKSCGHYVNTWDLKFRSSNEQEWSEWIATHPNVELYRPPSFVDSVKLSDFENYCIRHGRVRTIFDGLELSVKDIGMLHLLSIMHTFGSVLSGFGANLSDIRTDFSKGYDHLENGGKNFLTHILKKLKYQMEGGSPHNRIDGYFVHHLLSLEVHANFGFSKESLYPLLHMSKRDIQLISKNGFPKHAVRSR